MSPLYTCIICTTDDVPVHQMAKTPCVPNHNYVACKACLLKWFAQKLTCPLCATPAPIKSCLRRTELKARRALQAARKQAKHDAALASQQADEAAAFELAAQQVEEEHDQLVAQLLFMLRGQSV